MHIMTSMWIIHMQTLSIYLLEISVTLMGVGHRKTGFDIYLLLSQFRFQARPKTSVW